MAVGFALLVVTLAVVSIMPQTDFPVISKDNQPAGHCRTSSLANFSNEDDKLLILSLNIYDLFND